METVYFKISKNGVFIEGYVNINDDEATDVDYYFFDQVGMEQLHPFYHCPELVYTVDELNYKIDNFKNDYQINYSEIWDCILQSKENEHGVYHKFGFEIIVNEDAIFELDYKEYDSKGEWDSEYYLSFTPKFNGVKIIYKDDTDFVNPYTQTELKFKDILYDDGYILEVPKEYFETKNEDIIKEYEAEFANSWLWEEKYAD